MRVRPATLAIGLVRGLSNDDLIGRRLGPMRADSHVLEGFDLDDLDDVSLGEYLDRFAATKPTHRWLALDKTALLGQLGCWRKRRDTIGGYGLTLAGLLMFGKYEAIITAGAVPYYMVDYRDCREQQRPSDPWSERLFSDGTWEANLFQFSQRCWPKLIADLKITLPSQSAHRSDDTLVHTALREAFVNALVHTDYDGPGGIVIERYPERYKMENPGTLLVSEEQLRRGGVSQCRNRLLQRMFMLIGAGDQAGSGYRRIQEGWWTQRWPEPHLTMQAQPDRVRLELVMRCLVLEHLFAPVAEQRRRR
jgi:ATP-dependent DNA helicase RecG